MNEFQDSYNAAFLAANPEIARKIRKEVSDELKATCFKLRVISIKPKFAKMIYDGKKHWEFRKSAPPLMTMLAIYESAPVCAITGTVIFESKVEGWLYDVWHLAKHNKMFTNNLTGIGYDELSKYAGKKNMVAALRVGHTERLKTPLKIGFKPPQNWGTFWIKMDSQEGGAK